MASGWLHDGERGRSSGLTTKGLTLIEVIIILAVLAILVALLVPSTVQQLTAARRDTTLDEMDRLKIAMVGDPNLRSRGIRSDFAYLGDMGRLPANLDELLTQGAQPAYAFDSAKRTGAGWKGPYLTLGPGSDPTSHKRDAFGNDYTYDGTDYTNGQGQAVDAKLVTLGADGVAGGTGTDEDVTVEILRAETTATVTGYVFDNTGAPLDGAGIILHYPASGALTSTTVTADSTGFYQFTNIPFGMRSITQEPRLLLVPGSVRAFGGSNRSVEFRVANFSKSAVTVRTLTATYTPTGGAAFYNNATFGGTTVFNCSSLPGASGSTITFSANQTVAAGPGLIPVNVAVGAAFVQVADITIQGIGTEATVTLENFRSGGGSCNNGSFQNMSGASFSSVVLRNPSNVIVGQFSFSVP